MLATKRRAAPSEPSLLPAGEEQKCARRVVKIASKVASIARQLLHLLRPDGRESSRGLCPREACA